MSTHYSFPDKPSAFSRRKFIHRSLLATVLASLSAPAFVRGQNLNNKLHIAVIGAGGKGATDTDEVAKTGEDIYALCDVDGNTLASRGEKYPKAKRFRDYREMYSQIINNIDAVIVSTPDHHHALAAALAMGAGKHAFVQKPLTYSVAEARFLRDLAKRKKVATQMGNQGSAGNGLRRAVEVIQAGVIGQVRQLHVWSNRPVWQQGMDRPTGADPVPDYLDWDLWLGAAPFRPFKKEWPEEIGPDGKAKKSNRRGVYHTFGWRGWQDFGTGALGDMACHTVNMPFRALNLGYPTSVEATTTGMNKESYARSAKIQFEFPKRGKLAPVTFMWYDGTPDGNDTFRPHADITEDVISKMKKLPGSGCLLIGEKGRIFSPDDYGSKFFLRLNDEKELVASEEHAALKAIPENYWKSPGHYQEWVDACKGGRAAYSEFDIAAYLTEIILLGCVAERAGKKLIWDGPKMRAKNAPEAGVFVKRDYRKGWELPS
ncbi:MAG TPA: Gfo/Idh/MocA family oxidoreductase [Verrucomicrobiae bacterium]